MSIRSESSRNIRENNSFNNRVMSLDTVKDVLLKNTYDRGIELTYHYFINHPGIPEKHERYSYYLHYLIMFSNPQSVHNFIKEHHIQYGDYATRMFVNFPIISAINKNIITPLICAAQWSNDPQMARILYHWGADFSQIDVNGKYSEEKYGSYYVNHLNHIMAPDYFIIGIRTGREFIDIIKEIHYLAREIKPPTNWTFPSMAYRQRSSLSTTVVSSSPPTSSFSLSSSPPRSTYTIPEEPSTDQAEQHA